MAEAPLAPDAARRRVVIFDFDSTLAAVDVNLYGPQGVAAMGGRERVRALDAMLARIGEFGCDLGIVSFNQRATVVRTLEAAKLLRHFRSREVFGYEQVLKIGGSLRKSALVFAKFLKPRRLQPREIFFVDDNSDNIRDLDTNSRTAGCGLLHVRGGVGMVDADMAAVLDWCAGATKAKRRTQRSDDGVAVPWRAPPEVVPPGT